MCYKMEESIRIMLRDIMIDQEIVSSYEAYDAMTDQEIYDASAEYMGME